MPLCQIFQGAEDGVIVTQPVSSRDFPATREGS